MELKYTGSDMTNVAPALTTPPSFVPKVLWRSRPGCEAQAAVLCQWLLRRSAHSVSVSNPVHLPGHGHQRHHVRRLTGRCYGEHAGTVTAQVPPSLPKTLNWIWPPNQLHLIQNYSTQVWFRSAQIHCQEGHTQNIVINNLIKFFKNGGTGWPVLTCITDQ